MLEMRKCIRPCFSKVVKSAIILKKRLRKNIEVELYTCQIN